MKGHILQCLRAKEMAACTFKYELSTMLDIFSKIEDVLEKIKWGEDVCPCRLKELYEDFASFWVKFHSVSQDGIEEKFDGLLNTDEDIDVQYMYDLQLSVVDVILEILNVDKSTKIFVIFDKIDKTLEMRKKDVVPLSILEEVHGLFVSFYTDGSISGNGAKEKFDGLLDVDMDIDLSYLCELQLIIVDTLFEIDAQTKR